MALCSRGHALKATLLVAFLLILLNLLGSRRETAPMSATQWPKRTRPSPDSGGQLQHTQPQQTASNQTIPGQSNNQTGPPDLLNGKPTNGTVAPTKSTTPKRHNETKQPPAEEAAAAATATATGGHNETTKNSTSLSRTENLADDSTGGSGNVSSSSISIKHRNHSSNLVQTEEGQEGNCPPIPPNLDGPYEVDPTYEPLTKVEQKLAPKLQPGGQYSPRECRAHDRVAIIVPYRDREQHLPVFLKNLHPFLMKQQIEYGVYIVEQATGSQFNRASLMNVGFVEALKQKPWDCMVFHDVDLLPMDDRNLYTCPDQPRHMSVAVDTFGFKLPYTTIFGGVSAMTVKQFRTVNGFSNSFWGWGGEDDDMSNRLKHVGFHIARYPINIARYTMLSHKKEKANPKRYEKLNTGSKRFDSDGLNSLHYRLINLIRKPLYTWVHVEISPESS
uniref:Beta-1,4-N-acetylgalactosaminyltransferase n=1 Tax=Culex tarsalis TaxID=7177 RepID=A0A1Q3F3B5_CULTA